METNYDNVLNNLNKEAKNLEVNTSSTNNTGMSEYLTNIKQNWQQYAIFLGVYAGVCLVLFYANTSLTTKTVEVEVPDEEGKTVKETRTDYLKLLLWTVVVGSAIVAGIYFYYYKKKE